MWVLVFIIILIITVDFDISAAKYFSIITLLYQKPIKDDLQFSLEGLISLDY